MSSQPESANLVTFRRFHEAINTGDLELISQMLDVVVDPDVLFHAPVATDAPGVEGLRRVWTMILRAFPDVHVRADDVIAEDDKIVSRNTVTGTHRGDYRGMTPTGKVVAYQEIFIFRFSRGQIVEIWGVVDVDAVVQQLST